jgi:3-oxoacyl-[acyl-carrier protein] reductase
MDSARRQVAIVTGAGRGIGRAVALRLAQDGFDVIAVARSQDALLRLAQDAQPPGVCHPISADVGDETAVRRVVEFVRERFGRVDVLVNNAGSGVLAPLLDTTLVDWEAQMATNARGMFLFTREVARLMLPRGSGRIVNLSSIAGRHPAHGVPAYTASKHAAVGFSDSIARELKRAGITVYSLCPGAVNTDLRRDAVPDEDPASITQPEDIAQLIHFLVAGAGCGLQSLELTVA